MSCVQEERFLARQKEDKAKIIEKYKVGDIIKNATVKAILHLVAFLK